MSSVFCLRCEAGGGEEAATFLGPREGRKVGVLKFTARVLLPCLLWIESPCSYSHLDLLSLRPEPLLSASPEVQSGAGQSPAMGHKFNSSLYKFSNELISACKYSEVQTCFFSSSWSYYRHNFFSIFFNSTLELLWTYILVFFFQLTKLLTLLISKTSLTCPVCWYFLVYIFVHLLVKSILMVLLCVFFLRGV